MAYEKIVAAAEKVDGDLWKLADAVLAEVGTPTRALGRGGTRERSLVYREAAAALREAGFEFTQDRLYRLAWAANAFAPEDRKGLTVNMALLARRPALARRVLALAAADEVKPTLDYVRATVKQIEKHPEKQDAPSSALRHQAHVFSLGSLATQASHKGRAFIESLAGTRITAEEREMLRHEAHRVYETWGAALDLIENPLIASAEAFLKGVS